jgi:hypothetical protein
MGLVNWSGRRQLEQSWRDVPTCFPMGAYSIFRLQMSRLMDNDLREIPYNPLYPLTLFFPMRTVMTDNSSEDSIYCRSLTLSHDARLRTGSLKEN